MKTGNRKMEGLDAELVRRMVRAGLEEDRAWDDVTTAALVPTGEMGRAVIIAKAAGVLAGLLAAEAAFGTIDGNLVWRAEKEDGDRLTAGASIATIEGSLDAILRAERVALNFLSHLSGIATATNAVVRRLDGTNCKLRDTRKTTPGLRALEKYAVRVGGGTNHRMDLSDGVLIKDNHLASLRARGLGIADGVRMAREAQPEMRIEVEVTSMEEAREALAAGADELLLDNMSLEAMREVVGETGNRKSEIGNRTRQVKLEASGGITLENARAVAETGVDYISLGAITHSAPALDLSLQIV